MAHLLQLQSQHGIHTPQPFLPKPDLTLREYMAIKSFYSASDFEHSNKDIFLPVFTYYSLYVLRKGFQYMRWFV